MPKKANWKPAQLWSCCWIFAMLYNTCWLCCFSLWEQWAYAFTRVSTVTVSGTWCYSVPYSAIMTHYCLMYLHEHTMQHQQRSTAMHASEYYNIFNRHTVLLSAMHKCVCVCRKSYHSDRAASHKGMLAHYSCYYQYSILQLLLLHTVELMFVCVNVVCVCQRELQRTTDYINPAQHITTLICGDKGQQLPPHRCSLCVLFVWFFVLFLCFSAAAEQSATA